MSKKREQLKGTNSARTPNNVGFERSSYKADTMELPKLDIAPPTRYRNNNNNSSGQPRSERKSQVPQSKSNRKKVNNKKSQGQVPPPVQYKNREEQRKAQIARRKKRKAIRKITSIATLVILIVVICVVLFYTVLFKITSIKIDDNKIYTDGQILSSINVKEGDNLYAISKKNLSEYIVTEFPYIRSVEIQRTFPDKLIIKVKEDKSTFAYKDSEGYILLNDNLKVLEKNVKELPENVTVISGMKFKEFIPGQEVTFTDSKSEKRMDTMLEALKKCNLKPVTEISMKSSANNGITYDNRIVIKLGSLDDLEYRLTFAKKSIAELESENPNAKGRLDMTIDKYGYFTPESDK